MEFFVEKSKTKKTLLLSITLLAVSSIAWAASPPLENWDGFFRPDLVRKIQTGTMGVADLIFSNIKSFTVVSTNVGDTKIKISASRKVYDNNDLLKDRKSVV